MELESHMGEARAGEVGREAVIDAFLVDDRMQLGLHAAHGIDLARKRWNEEGVHRGRAGDLEIDRNINRSGEFIDAANAEFGIEEQPLPVHGHHFDRDWLGLGGHLAVLIDTLQRAIGVETVGGNPGHGAEHQDDGDRSRPDNHFKASGVVPLGIIILGFPRFAILPCEEQCQGNDRDDDEQHQNRGRDDKVALLDGDVARRVHHHEVTAAEQQQSRDCQKGG
ncbi:hypothetical protein D3C86_1400700 [compost metagenome]